jgi:predicted porin
MKKSLLALAVLSAFAGAASAQSSVTLSGRVDAGVIRSGGQWSLGGSQSGYNALTFSGREDLGGGIYAFFALNHRFNINTGTNNPGGNAGSDTNQFYRNTAVGLGGGFGDVRLGRILMPLQDMNGGFDAFDTGYVATTHTGGINATVRANNAIYYRTPSLGGFFVHAAIAAGDQQVFGVAPGSPVGTAPSYRSSAKRPTGIAGGYYGGPFRIGLAFDKNGAEQKTTGLYGSFNAGFATFMGQFERGDQARTTGGTEKVGRWSLSGKVPLGAVTLKAGYERWSKEDVKKLGVGLQYDLSKRTNLYTNVGKLGGDGTVKFGPITSTQRKVAFDIGVTHAF